MRVVRASSVTLNVLNGCVFGYTPAVHTREAVVSLQKCLLTALFRREQTSHRSARLSLTDCLKSHAELPESRLNGFTTATPLSSTRAPKHFNNDTYDG